jgi:Uma2 family endonuclease
MVAQPHRQRMTVEEYLELDRRSPDVRYEYIDGQVYLMTGGSAAHALIIANLIREIGIQLRGGPCKVFSSDVKVCVSETRYLCPDITVSCDERDRQVGVEMLKYPRFVIEVLSPSTEQRDRHKKSNLYRAMPAIEEYALVESQVQAVEVYRRMPNSFWGFAHFEAGDRIEFVSLGITLPLEAVYEDVIFPPESLENPSV